MLIQRASFVFGLAFVLAAALGFLATGLVMPGMHDSMTSVPKLLGLFPVNVLHNLVHLVFGLWGLLAARSARAAMTFGLASGAAYCVLAATGIFVPDGFGLVPIGGYDVLLHAVIGAALVGAALTEAFRPQPESQASV